MQILDLTKEQLSDLYDDYISDPSFESIRDNAFCLVEHEQDILSGADYLYDDFLSWLQEREAFTDEEVSIFVNIHGDNIYANLVSGLQ